MTNKQYFWLMVIVVVIACGVSSLGTLAAVKALPQSQPQIIEVPMQVSITDNQTRKMEELLQRLEMQAEENARRDVIQDPGWLWHEPEVITVTNTVNNTIVKEPQVTEVLMSPMNPRFVPWGSLGEITQFVYESDVWRNDYVPITHDCDDFAIELDKRAMALVMEGYMKGRYFGLLWIKEGEEYHLQNYTMFDGEYYEIEPQAKYGSVKLIEWD